MAEFGRHQIVEDGVDGGVEVEHNATQIQEAVVGVDADIMDCVAISDYYPQSENAKREEASEERHDHGHQHQHHLEQKQEIKNLTCLGFR